MNIFYQKIYKGLVLIPSIHIDWSITYLNERDKYKVAIYVIWLFWFIGIRW